MARTATVLVPKDWINFNLTGQSGQDITEASLSFLMDWWTRDWSPELCALVGTDRTLLPRLAAPGDVLAGLSPKAAASLGLAPRIPVLVGGGDCPMALLGGGRGGAGDGGGRDGNFLDHHALARGAGDGPGDLQRDFGVRPLGRDDASRCRGDAVRWVRRETAPT